MEQTVMLLYPDGRTEQTIMDIPAAGDGVGASSLYGRHNPRYAGRPRGTPVYAGTHRPMMRKEKPYVYSIQSLQAVD